MHTGRVFETFTVTDRPGKANKATALCLRPVDATETGLDELS